MSNFVRSNHFGTRVQPRPIAPNLAVQPGDVISRITSGQYQGLFGPRDIAATDGRQTAANIDGVTQDRSPAADATGVQERFLPAQAGNVVTVISHGSSCDANQGFLYNTSATRLTLNAESGLATKTQMAGMGFSFDN